MTKIGPKQSPPPASGHLDAPDALSRKQRKALARQYVSTSEQLQKARTELRDLRADYWGHEPRGEDFVTALELRNSIRKLEAEAQRLEGALKRHGLRNPKDATEWAVGIFASALLPGVASARAVVGIERSVDEMTGKAKIRPFAGPEFDTVAGEVGYVFGGADSGALFSVSTAPFMQVGKDPHLGTEVEVSLPGVGGVAIGSKGAVVVEPEVELGAFGVGMTLSVKDKRLAKVTEPAAEKVEHGRDKVKDALLRHLPHSHAAVPGSEEETK